MLPAKRPSRSATDQRGGVALLVVVFVAISVGGLSVAMALGMRGASIDVDRSDGQIRALELAETGLAHAQMEIAAHVDHDGDGIGNAHGSYAGGTYAVTATQTAGTDDWTLVSTGRAAKGQRRIEQGVRRTVTIGTDYAIEATGDITVSGGASQTDAYDSRLGSYAAQATNSDALGPYALGGGGIGANGNINVSGGMIRGDAIPGVGGTTTVGGTVTGSTTPRTTPLTLPDPPYADFLAASTVNDNGNWTGAAAYDPVKKVFSVSGGAKVTFPGGTYFFTKFTISGGSTVEFTGPTKIYDVGAFTTSGGSISNATGAAKNVSVIAHPYAIPGYTSVKSISTSISGGSGSILTYYGPATKLTISGGSGVFGAFVGQDVTISGGTFVHYDAALRAGGAGLAHITQLFWHEGKPPLE